MLKQLLEDRIGTLRCIETPFRQHVYKLQNCVEVLGIEAKSLQIENDQIVMGSIVNQSIFFKSLRFGQTNITITDGVNKAIVQVFVRPSGEIVVEVKPYLGNAEIVLAYYKTILADTAIAIDLKGALKHYLVAHQMMNDADSIAEVHYQSMHPNVLKNSYAGNFILGCHTDGREITNAEEYALANRLVTLKFTKIVIQQQGVKKIIALQMLLTFMITNHVFVSNEEIPDCLIEDAINRERNHLVLV
ncbi:hypothetical protein [Lysinibacillus sp. FJAT-14222]|uniref:hypothetical protein n=1 Tax=Lysinibacillus sp. FJAT-14222 TaxID=1932366 RepID=UPI0006ADE658|nr:hypothetical protein [Lysinibacillus sp. FJAT-14222]KOS63960.1 hypothetical protein AN161_05050 [Lysinibacillus sp. FJAT-14222]